ncbi:MAG: transglycosylase domain-containing protein [Patescibacteria group bacterium]|nr:transglycosylase domain-containing protein [Patescibacteria group bacterium]MCL5431946.1 transglycosylase domain-containing protein [Patescibacteria group bacterium]
MARGEKWKEELQQHWRVFMARPVVYLPAIIIVALILCLLSLVWILKDLPSPADLTNRPLAQTTKILDRNGKLLYDVFVSENRTVVPLSDIPKSMQQATIAVEDKNFYTNVGFDFFGGFLRAVKDMIVYHQLEGGSTITQQLIKNSLLTPEQTISRKIRELILAFWTDRIYSKDQILAMYLNRIPYGGTAYGVEEAAQIYFNKHAKDLDLAQAALLAGLPQAPTYYSPFGTDPSRAVDRQHEVLQRMADDGFITQSQLQAAESETLTFASPSAGIKAPHFVAYIQEQLVNKYGEATVEQGGLKVTTTLDLDLQEAVQATLSAAVAKQAALKVGNGAALVTNPSTGEILAMVGSKDYFATDGGKVNVTLANRSPGSSIKPLNYALGFLKGTTTPATPWIDGPFCFPPSGGKPYCPTDYDNKWHGVAQTRFALGNSFNVPAVKELAVNTVSDFIATASAMGITTFTDPSRYGYSLTLGGGEVKMVDMATAYSVFANAGRKADLVSILKVEDANGKVLEDNTAKLAALTKEQNIPWDGSRPWIPHGNWILPSEVTYLISHILLDDSARSETFGAGSILNVHGLPVSVKTGTTEDKRDNWTIGYTSGQNNRLVAVWVGNNDNSPMSPYLESGNTGAAPIWHDIMDYTLRALTVQWPAMPSGVVFTQVCSLSGLLPDHDCPQRGEYFIKAFAPTQKDDVWNQKKSITVFKDTHKQPGPNDHPDPSQLTQEDHIVISDLLQKDFCVDCPL